MIGGSKNVSKASARESGPEGSRKPRTYASSRRVLDAARNSAERLWEKLLENAGAGASAAGSGQKLLDSAGELGSAAGLAGTVARTVATRVL